MTDNADKRCPAEYGYTKETEIRDRQRESGMEKEGSIKNGFWLK